MKDPTYKRSRPAMTEAQKRSAKTCRKMKVGDEICTEWNVRARILEIGRFDFPARTGGSKRLMGVMYTPLNAFTGEPENEKIKRKTPFKEVRMFWSEFIGTNYGASIVEAARKTIERKKQFDSVANIGGVLDVDFKLIQDNTLVTIPLEQFLERLVPLIPSLSMFASEVNV